ncbi:MAG: hypothetical protein ACP5OA_00540 [Candidatus Woesearchaeota archaeon]
MEEKSNLYIVAIVGIVAVVALVILVTGGNRERIVLSESADGVMTVYTAEDATGQVMGIRVKPTCEGSRFCRSNADCGGEGYCNTGTSCCI